MRAKVLRRDGYRCRSCRSPWSLHVHHIVFREHGGRTHPRNLLTLCIRCHGLVHGRLLVIEGTSAERATFHEGSGRRVAEAEPVAPIAPPLLAPAPAPAPAPEGSEVTLASIPAEVDPTWWRKHAHLVRDRGEKGGLRFEAGLPDEGTEAAAVPTATPERAFDGLVGQDERVARLRLALEAARLRGKPLAHVLLTGPAGTGKTTIARGLAAEAGRPLVEGWGSWVTDRAGWLRLLVDLPEGCVLFLDEGHTLPPPMMCDLLQALAERRLTLPLCDGVRSRSITLRLPTFTLVLATTDEGAIPPALRSRFGVREAMSHYGEAELAQLVGAAAAGHAPELTEAGARRMVRAARGTPREALALLDRVQGHALLNGEARLDVPAVERALAHLGCDADDLDPASQQYLEVLRASSAPMSLARLARTLGTTPHTLVEHVETWLFARGLVRMTRGGRLAAPYARRARAVGSEARRAVHSGAPNVRRGFRTAASTA
jgi:Holliday junction DNA helicase RuvB